MRWRFTNPYERRVIYKAEAMEQGTNTRFVVSTRSADPKELYEFYTRRGESENWIKDFKLHMRPIASAALGSSQTSLGYCCTLVPTG